MKIYNYDTIRKTVTMVPSNTIGYNAAPPVRFPRPSRSLDRTDRPVRHAKYIYLTNIPIPISIPISIYSLSTDNTDLCPLSYIMAHHPSYIPQTSRHIVLWEYSLDKTEPLWLAESFLKGGKELLLSAHDT